jgi:ribosomal protein S12
MAKHTALPPASALRRVVRARLGGLLPVTALTADTPVQYHNLERWPAAALSLNYPRGRGDVAH